MRGLVLLFGNGEKVTLNHLTMEQIDTVVDKLKLAKIKTTVNAYDRETAVILELVPDRPDIPLELFVLTTNQSEIQSKESNDLSEYVYKMYMHGFLYCLSFQLVH
jgi:hypothetical protein